MKILAVDDDEIFLKLLVASLSASGYTDVTTATSAGDALIRLAETDEPFDVFLLDIDMPEVNGIELCSTLRTMHGYEDAPIVMLTAMDARRFMDRALSAGATDYISKPLDGLEFLTRLRIAARLAARVGEMRMPRYSMASRAQIRARCAKSMSDQTMPRERPPAQAPRKPSAFRGKKPLALVDG